MKKKALPGTQLYSKDVFHILMDYQIVHTIRYQTPLSLIYLEMKSHVLGGKTSRSISSTFEVALNSRLRSVDIPTRYGKGYLILLPMTNEAGVRTVRERLLGIFEKEFKTKEGKLVKFSLQIGVASHNGGPTLMKETLLKTAKLDLQ
jgi:GGDEF domain-containing protein